MSHQEISEEELRQKRQQEFRDAIERWRADPHHMVVSHGSPPIFLAYKGFVGRDVFGRVYIDRCPNDEVHILRPPEPGQERRDQCRFYLDDLIPGIFEGEEVTVGISIRITPCTGASDVRTE